MCVCEVCNSEFKGIKGKANRFCSKDCLREGQRRKREQNTENRNCLICDSVFQAHKNDSKKLCSVGCYRKYQTTHEYSSKFPTKNFFECEYCRKTIAGGSLSVKRDGTTSDRKFCDRSCYDSHRESVVLNSFSENCLNCEKPITSSSTYCSMDCRTAHKRPEPVNCISCGVLFTAVKTLGDRVAFVNGVKTCSEDCLRAFYREDEARKKKISDAFKGGNHPNWQGGASYLNHGGFRGKDWQKIRAVVIKRARYKCEHCGLSSEQQKRKHGRNFSVNHKKPFHQFGGETSKANELSNLECLCDSCHTKADWDYRKNNEIQEVILW